MIRRIALGSYTHPAGHVPDARGAGITIADWDTETGGVTVRAVVSALPSPAYLDWDATTSTLYSVTELDHDDGRVCAWRLRRDDEPELITCQRGPGRVGTLPRFRDSVWCSPRRTATAV